MSQSDLRDNITQRLASGLKNGLVPWRRPWASDPNSGHPCNFVSKKNYKGINPLLLTLTGMEKQYKSKYWATYKQWSENKGQVRKGEKGTQIVFYTVLEKEADVKGVMKKRKIFFMRGYTVFNLDQVSGDKLDKYRVSDSPEAPTFSDWGPAEAAIAATEAKIVYGGNQACYMRPVGDYPNHTGGDFIRMPHKAQFPDQADFYCTTLHELTHWSECRLGWEGTYAMGELIAEISGCYLTAELGVPNLSLENHNRYLDSWLKEMQGDPKWIFQASTQASKAADYVLSFSRQNSDSNPEIEPNFNEIDSLENNE